MRIHQTKRIYDTIKWGILYSSFQVLFNIGAFAEKGSLNVPFAIISVIVILLFFLPAVLQKQYEISVEKNPAEHAGELKEIYYTNSVWKIWAYRILKVVFFLAWASYPGLMDPTENRKKSFSFWGKKK